MDNAVPTAFRDLLDARYATLATIGADGRPHLSEVLFLHEGGEFKVSLHVARQKTKNLQRNPAINLFVLDLKNPLRYLEVRGDATLADDTDYAFADRVGAKYGGIDLRTRDDGDHRRVVVTIEPSRIVTVNLSGG
jgi:PPOX class probable F420-dependent enzyme